MSDVILWYILSRPFRFYAANFWRCLYEYFISHDVILKAEKKLCKLFVTLFYRTFSPSDRKPSMLCELYTRRLERRMRRENVCLILPRNVIFYVRFRQFVMFKSGEKYPLSFLEPWDVNIDRRKVSFVFLWAVRCEHRQKRCVTGTLQFLYSKPPACKQHSSLCITCRNKQMNKTYIFFRMNKLTKQLIKYLKYSRLKIH